MTDGIFHIRDDGTLVEMTEQPYDSEDLLQDLLANYPNLMPGRQISSTSPRRWLLVKREMGVPDREQGSDRWALDHLFLDQDAIPTLVEVKRSCDTRSRREVVAQMLDYAANAIVYWPAEKIRAEFEVNCEAKGLDPTAELTAFLDGEEAELFWQRAKTNLEAGRIRMLFVSDAISDELRRIIEFLNRQMTSAEVLGIEIKQFVGPGMRSLVPRVIGQTAEAEKTKQTAGNKPKLDERTYLSNTAARRGEEVAKVAETLLRWAKNHPSVELKWGTESVSFFVRRETLRDSLLNVWAGGGGFLSMAVLKKRKPFDDLSAREQLAARLRQCGVSLAKLDGFPGFQLADLRDNSAVERFLDTLSWIIEEQSRAPQQSR